VHDRPGLVHPGRVPQPVVWLDRRPWSRKRVGMVDLLTAEALNRQLDDLPGFLPAASGNLEVALRAPSFADAVRLISLVADEAEEMNHHPDVDLRWRTVTFTLSTHSAGGVTEKDIELARRILAAAGAVSATAVTPDDRVEIAIDCVDADAIRAFWRGRPGYREQLPPVRTLEL